MRVGCLIPGLELLIIKYEFLFRILTNNAKNAASSSLNGISNLPNGTSSVPTPSPSLPQTDENQVGLSLRGRTRI